MKAQRHDEEEHHEEHTESPALTLRTPAICTGNFSANNNDPVQFQNIPAAGVTITQVSGYTFPFSPIVGSSNGLYYTTLQQGGQLIVVVPAINQSYPYTVSCSCPETSGNHSVTVG